MGERIGAYCGQGGQIEPSKPIEDVVDLIAVEIKQLDQMVEQLDRHSIPERPYPSYVPLAALAPILLRAARGQRI